MELAEKLRNLRKLKNFKNQTLKLEAKAKSQTDKSKEFDYIN